MSIATEFFCQSDSRSEVVLSGSGGFFDFSKNPPDQEISLKNPLLAEFVRQQDNGRSYYFRLVFSELTDVYICRD